MFLRYVLKVDCHPYSLDFIYVPTPLHSVIENTATPASFLRPNFMQAVLDNYFVASEVSCSLRCFVIFFR